MGMVGNLFRVNPKELDEFLKDSSLLEEKVYAEDESSMDDMIDLDKAWEAIYYLLTGRPIAEIEHAQPPMSWCMLSGHIIDEEQDLGYGPAHYITADQVKQLNNELDKITVDTLLKKYDGKKMNAAGVYPEIWDDSESKDYVTEYFEQLKEFYQTAAKEGKAVISFIN
jgi:hypothetical protein